MLRDQYWRMWRKDWCRFGKCEPAATLSINIVFARRPLQPQEGVVELLKRRDRVVRTLVLCMTVRAPIHETVLCETNGNAFVSRAVNESKIAEPAGQFLGLLRVYDVLHDVPVGEHAVLADEKTRPRRGAIEDSPASRALPIGDRVAMKPTRGCSAGPAAAGTRSWDATVADFRAVPGARVEPWHGSVTSSNESVLALMEAVPGLELNLDVGHVVGWGGDPVELVPHASHVQLRQARPGHAQSREGEVDLPAILRALEAADYRGKLSVEYFDLPDRGWPLDDPIGAALDFTAQLRALL